MPRRPNGRALLRAYITWIGSKSFHPKTREEYRRYAERWVLWLGKRKKHPCDIALQDVGAWWAGICEEYATGSLPRIRNACRSFYEYLGLEGYIAFNPFAQIELPKIHYAPRTFLADEQLHRLVLSAPAETWTEVRDRAIVAFLVGTGARNGEARGVNLDRYDPDNQQAYVMGKNRKPGWVGVPPFVCMILDDWIERARPIKAERGEQALFVGARGKRISAVVLNDGISRVCRAVGVKRVTAQDLRASFGTSVCHAAEEDGASTEDAELQAMKALRHEHVSTTRNHYLKPDPDRSVRPNRRYGPLSRLAGDGSPMTQDERDVLAKALRLIRDEERLIKALVAATKDEE